MFDSGSIPWDHPVEIFEACRDLRVRSVEMSLRDAVETFRDTPQERRWALGVGLQKMPNFMTVGGRPIAVGFLNASTLTTLVDMLPDATEI